MAEVYVGEVRNGVVVFEGDALPLAEGTKVRIEPLPMTDIPVEKKSLAELFEGRLGRIHSGGQERLSEGCGEKFSEHLQSVHVEDRKPRP